MFIFYNAYVLVLYIDIFNERCKQYGTIGSITCEIFLVCIKQTRAHF